MFGVTQQQRKVLDFIEEFIARERYSPSYREIAKGMGYRSVSGVMQMVQQLEARGRIVKGRSANSIRVVRP